MSQLTSSVAVDRPMPLPQPHDTQGSLRRIGIEIEFGGLSEHAAARVAQDCLGGELKQFSEHELRLTGSALAELKIYLDTSFRDASSTIARIGTNIARRVVPVEIVTEPLQPEQLPLCDALRDALRTAGAIGTRNGPSLGFGLHLNPATTGGTAADILPVVRAFALLEDWLRHADPINLTRRVLPFAHPYPAAFVDEIAEHGAGWSLDALLDSYLSHNPTRNRGLDLLPIIAELAPERLEPVRNKVGKVSARPAFHYRLPDSRVDEEDWSVAYEVNRWVMIERVASDAALSAQLAEDWLAHRAALTTTRANWRDHVEVVLRSHDLAGAAWPAP